MHGQDLHRVGIRLGWRKGITSSRARCVAGGFLLASFIAGPAMAATFVVDTTSDLSVIACTEAAADCSLRGAIAAANVAADLDLIEFNIPTNDPGCDADGICRIAVGSSLSISRGLTIDGYTQPGSQPNTIPAPGANNAQLKIEITSADFVNLGVALFSLSSADASPFSLRGLAMVLPTGAIVTGGLRHDHRGNWFCVDARGASPAFNLPCSALGLSGFNRSIRIGGPDPADRNVIAGAAVIRMAFPEVGPASCVSTVLSASVARSCCKAT